MCMLTLHLGPLDVNLDEFVKAIKDLVSTDLDNKSKKDISELIEGYAIHTIPLSTH